MRRGDAPNLFSRCLRDAGYKSGKVDRTLRETLADISLAWCKEAMIDIPHIAQILPSHTRPWLWHHKISHILLSLPVAPATARWSRNCTNRSVKRAQSSVSPCRPAPAGSSASARQSSIYTSILLQSLPITDATCRSCARKMVTARGNLLQIQRLKKGWMRAKEGNGSHINVRIFVWVRPSIQQGPFTEFYPSRHIRLLSHITRSTVSRTSKGKTQEGQTNTYLKSKDTSTLSEHFWKKAARHRPHSDSTALQEQCHEVDVIKYLTNQRIKPSVSILGHSCSARIACEWKCLRAIMPQIHVLNVKLKTRAWAPCMGFLQ